MGRFSYAQSAEQLKEISVTDWAFKIGDRDYKAPNLETLQQWAREGRVKPEHLIYHPTLAKWMYGKEVAELGDIFGKQENVKKTGELNQASLGLGCLGLVMLFVFPPAGVVLLIIAIVMSAIVHIKR